MLYLFIPRRISLTYSKRINSLSLFSLPFTINSVTYSALAYSGTPTKLTYSLHVSTHTPLYRRLISLGHYTCTYLYPKQAYLFATHLPLHTFFINSLTFLPVSSLPSYQQSFISSIPSQCCISFYHPSRVSG